MELREHEWAVLRAIERSMLGVQVDTVARLVVPVDRVASFCGGMRRRQVRFDLGWLARKGLVEIVLRPGAPEMCGLTAAGVAMVVGEHEAQEPLRTRTGSVGLAVRSQAPDRGAGGRRAAGHPDREPHRTPPTAA